MSLHYCASCGKTLAEQDAQTIVNRVRPLTPKQRRIYDYVLAYIATFGFAPSLAEIAAHFRLASLASVHEHLVNLERRGWIQRNYNESRSIVCVGEGPATFASLYDLMAGRGSGA